MELKQVDVIGELEAHSNANTSNSRLTCISNKDKWGGPQASLVSQAATKTGHIGGHQCHCLVSLRPLMGTTHGGLAAQGDIFRKNQDRREDWMPDSQQALRRDTLTNLPTVVCVAGRQ